MYVPCAAVGGQQAEGILKYTHNDSIQCLAYNPVTQQLASGAASDLGLWSPEQKAVTKHKVGRGLARTLAPWCRSMERLARPTHPLARPQCGAFVAVSSRAHAPLQVLRPTCVALQVPSKILSVAWTMDGTLLAVGCYDGSVSIRDRAGNEKARFSAGQMPAWSVAWSFQVCLRGL